MNTQEAIAILDASNKILRAHMLLARKAAGHLGKYGYSCKRALDEYRAVKLAIRALRQVEKCRCRRGVRGNNR